MQTSRFELIQCWRDERVDQVINKEAASVDRATFLATHMPLQSLEYKRELRQITDKSEEGLLQELQRCAAENIHAFVVIQGIPGTGKSHLIRWLKERYQTEENGQDERVLFIERAQCSLSSTLEQIIRSEVFDEATMCEQLEKLQGARTALSQEALADTLLDQLRIACTEAEEESVELPTWLKRNDSLVKFLLDYRVREELKKPGGPIDRLVRFLRNGTGAGTYTGEAPQFKEQDFGFINVGFLRKFEGYNEVKLLVERLSGEDGREKRQILAGLLNRFIRYAIGHATALTSDDFKQVFADLRRYLYQQGRNLALFIEDITVLTGIDRGLLDVLVAQHKGTGEQELCRLISVVGITDSYYNDLVPDNIKERITYHVSLSEENASLALSDAHALENLASRYLNAMRLEQAELESWSMHRAGLDELPNACERCAFRGACHQAFGYYTINAGSEREQRLGLYPFNRQALSTFYQHIDTTKSRQTQRTFLYNVLHYILQSHGARLRQRGFPPALTDLGGEFTDFSLANLLQRETIRAQGGFDWGKIMTLVTIWGDRTVNAVEVPNEPVRVGGLTREVFLAFGLPAIPGERLTHTVEASKPAPPQMSTQSRVPAQTGQRVASPLPAGAGSEAKENPVNDRLKKYQEDIASWLNGNQLLHYEYYGDLLHPFIRGSIDWDFYGISPFQVAEVLRGRRNLHIEGQVGKTNASYFYTLNRSSELAAVLQGLIEIKELGPRLEPATLGGYLSQFSLWMNQHELEIVDFVRQPNHISPEVLPLVQITLLDCLLLACLQGELKATYAETQELFLDLIHFCGKTRISTEGWEIQLKQAQEKHSTPWAKLMRRFNPNVIRNLCENCLQLLNCAQGTSTDVKFVDAATGIRILKEFRAGKWQLPDLKLMGDTTRESWAQAVAVYRAFQENFAGAIEGEQEAIQKQLQLLDMYIGEDSYEDIFHSITEMVQTFQQSNRGLAFSQEKQFSADNLQKIAEDLKHVLEIPRGEAFILRCSQASEQLDELKKHIEYLKKFVNATEGVKKSSEGRLAKLRQEAEAFSSQEMVQKLYQEITLILDSLAQSGEDA